jgi:hypothetical protein
MTWANAPEMHSTTARNAAAGFIGHPFKHTDSVDRPVDIGSILVLEGEPVNSEEYKKI